MKTLKNYFLYLLLLFVTVMSGCQQDELETMSLQPVGIGKVANPGGTRILPPEVIKQEYPQATKWRIIWEDDDFDNDNWTKYSSFFNIFDGSIHSIHYLNNTDPQNTALPHMSFLFDNIAAPSRYPSLDHQAIAKSTQFKRSDMSAEEMMDLTQNNPDLFQVAFETEPYQVDEVQPLSDEGGSYYYDTNFICTFKTDDASPRYGAIRVVQLFNPRIIDVVVKKNGIGGFIPVPQ